MITEAKIREAVAAILRAAPDGSKVIVFGSHARGDARPNSDLDLLVIEPKVTDRLSETIRLRRVLRPMRLAVDLIVVNEERFRYWRDTPNTVYYDAAHEGRAYDSIA